MQWFAGKSAQEMIAELGMQPIAGEGAYWAPGDRITTMNCIYALMTDEYQGFSAMHLLDLDEGWQWLAGAPLTMLQLNADGTSREIQLDQNNSQVIVPRGVWQGAKTQGEWTLVSCWCSPAFEEELFHLGERSSLIAQYPAAEQLIKEDRKSVV